VTTIELTNKLKEYDNIDDFMQENANEFDEDGFRRFLDEMLQRKGLNATKLATESGVSVPYTLDLFKGRKHRPRKDMLIRLAFGLSLNLSETNRLLTLGGVSELRSKLRRESIIIFCLDKGYDVEKVDELLAQYNLEVILDKDKA